MATEHRDPQVFFSPVSASGLVSFQALSVTDFHGKSATEGYIGRFGAFSFTSGLTPLYDFNPNTAAADDVKRVLATLILHLFKEE